MLIDAGIEPNEAKKEIKMLLEHFCKYTELDKCKGVQLSEKQLEIIEEKATKRANTKLPIQYIIGEAYFMGEFFKVTPDVLIPRDETEILVTKAIEFVEKDEMKNVLALRVALDNVTRLGINNRAVFRKSDLFSKVREEEKFDMIISNPPYIPIGTILSDEVNYEPRIALFADENGLRFYREIVEQAPSFLNRQGKLLFELGIGEASAVKTFMEKAFTDIHIEKDLAGIDRIIYGTLKN